MHLQALEHLAAIAQRDVELELHHLEVGRRRRLCLRLTGVALAHFDSLVADSVITT